MNTKILESRKLYTICLNYLKYLPITLSLFQIILLILNYNGISVPIITYFGGSSILLIFLLFLLSYIFKFCNLFRLPLYYITLIGCMNILRYFGYIPTDLDNLYRNYIILSGIFIVIYVYLMYKNRNNPKVDYISELCKRYNCDCLGA